RAGQIIEVILAGGQRVSATELAIGKLNALKRTETVISSESNTAYVDIPNETKAGAKTAVKGDANPIGCILGECGFETEISIENVIATKIGTSIETTSINSTETVWSPTELAIAQYNSIGALKEAEANAKIEGANSAAEIKRLLLLQSELLIQVELSQTQFNQVVNEHNMLVDQYFLALAQRASTVVALQESYLSKPYFRLFRDGAALEAARTLEQAQQAAYLTAKALEYYTLSPVPYMHELYRVRNPQNLRAFLDKLAVDYAPIAPQKFSKVTYRLSLAEDIYGLTDANLNPDGLLTDSEVETMRAQLFQEILINGRFTNPDTGFDQIGLPFSTSLDNRKFLNGVFNNRITRTSSSDPGCTSGGGCRGVWLNIVTEQDPAELQGDFPKVTLTHAGIATYRDGNLQEVSYDPGPALMVGRVLPDGFGGNGREAALVSAHINLPPGAEPNTNLAYDNFYNLSVATTQWMIQLDLTNPLVNTQLDFSKIKDIEIRMDTTYVTPNSRRALVDLDLQRVEAETVGIPVSDQVIDEIAALEATLPMLETSAAQVQSSAVHDAAQLPPDPNRYIGTVSILEPVPLGTLDIGFSLEIGQDNMVSGSLCIACGPLFKSDGEVPISGSYSPVDGSVTFKTGAVPYEIAGRTAYRTWEFSGELTDGRNLIEGSYTETVTGFITRPVVATGNFLVSRPSRIGQVEGERQLLLNSSTAIVERNGTIDLTVLMRDGDGEPLSGIAITLAATSGTLSSAGGTTDGNGELRVTFTAGNSVGTAMITAQADGLIQIRTISIVASAPPQAAADEGTVEAGRTVEIDILANDSAGDDTLDLTSVVIIDQPTLGTVSINPTSGVLSYTAAETSAGTDIFTYSVANVEGIRSEAASVTVTVTT
ncbi:MAG: Ig-like domain-containing protein, partial [Chloroflexota bacterium]